MSLAQPGDTVLVQYAGKLEDGRVFDSTAGASPMQCTLGQHQLISGFEDALVGMSEGETKTVTLSPELAYGEHRSDLVLTIDRGQIPTDSSQPQVGQEVQLRTARDAVVTARVTEVAEETITLDANHPLAGEQLTFDLELVEILTSSNGS